MSDVKPNLISNHTVQSLKDGKTIRVAPNTPFHVADEKERQRLIDKGAARPYSKKEAEEAEKEDANAAAGVRSTTSVKTAAADKGKK